MPVRPGWAFLVSRVQEVVLRPQIQQDPRVHGAQPVLLGSPGLSASKSQLATKREEYGLSAAPPGWQPHDGDVSTPGRAPCGPSKLCSSSPPQQLLKDLMHKNRTHRALRRHTSTTQVPSISLTGEKGTKPTARSQLPLHLPAHGFGRIHTAGRALGTLSGAVPKMTSRAKCPAHQVHTRQPGMQRQGAV